MRSLITNLGYFSGDSFCCTLCRDGVDLHRREDILDGGTLIKSRCLIFETLNETQRLWRCRVSIGKTVMILTILVFFLCNCTAGVC